ncbi:hypothetical protein BT67DRAFT_138093 [Trichocladium antarcticum]|uniref:Stc1 domain-containing protein n=1 Tax=Trichocladium antarcticum TaxID=1450529 RepID=A0AAN6ZBJ4_9PEZI|nr:hypothetical protein BT67DRAFT_138093 [Trichocladium antarcticum]
MDTENYSLGCGNSTVQAQCNRNTTIWCAPSHFCQLPLLSFELLQTLAISRYLCCPPSSFLFFPVADLRYPSIYLFYPYPATIAELRLGCARMHFSVTREVGWEADDESENPKPGRKVSKSKRYRFIFDFGRGSPENGTTSSSKTAVTTARQEGSFQPKALEHSCVVCGKTRSGHYHQQHPPKAGRDAIPSLCRRCRRDRKARIADRGRDGHRRRRVTKLQARVDHRQWCVNCGVLRSEQYHQARVSGSLAPWSEICGKCRTAAENDGKHRLRGLYVENLEAQNRTARRQYELAQDSPLRHQPRLSARKQGSVYDTDESAPSTPGIPIHTLHLGDSSYRAHPVIRSAERGDMPDCFKTSKQLSANPRVRSRIQTAATVDTDPSDSNTGDPLPARHQNPLTTSPPQQQGDPDVQMLPKHGRNSQLTAAAATTPKSEPRKPKQPPSQHAQEHHNNRKPEPAPKGISDMYWASAEGMRFEQLLSPTLPSPGGVYTSHTTKDTTRDTTKDYNNNNSNYDFGYGHTTIYHHHHHQAADDAENSDCATPGLTPTSFAATGHSSSSSSKTCNRAEGATQVWEVDSDEADEISRARY